MKKQTARITTQGTEGLCDDLTPGQARKRHKGWRYFLAVALALIAPALWDVSPMASCIPSASGRAVNGGELPSGAAQPDLPLNATFCGELFAVS